MDTLRLERELRRGWRHFIGEADLRCGDTIEVFTGAAWIAGRYEAEGLRVPERFPITCLWVDDAHYLVLPEGVPARLPAH